jgi:predicted SnoaL-like aldol condensation-catalyzing enzyme
MERKTAEQILKPILQELEDRMHACRDARKVCNEAGQAEQARVWNEKLKEGAYYRDFFEQVPQAMTAFANQEKEAEAVRFHMYMVNRTGEHHESAYKDLYRLYKSKQKEK